MKSPGGGEITIHFTTSRYPGRIGALRKQVSNRGEMVRKGLLERVKGKKGTYRRVGDTPEQAPAHPLEDETDIGRLRILRTIPNPLPMRLPLGLARDDVDPNGMDFWFRIEKGCRFILVDKPKDADKLVAAARKQANGGK